MKLGYIHRYHRHIAILSVTFCPTKKYTEPHNIPLFTQSTQLLKEPGALIMN